MGISSRIRNISQKLKDFSRRELNYKYIQPHSLGKRRFQNHLFGLTEKMAVAGYDSMRGIDNVIEEGIIALKPKEGDSDLEGFNNDKIPGRYDPAKSRAGTYINARVNLSIDLGVLPELMQGHPFYDRIQVKDNLKKCDEKSQRDLPKLYKEFKGGLKKIVKAKAKKGYIDFGEGNIESVDGFQSQNQIKFNKVEEYVENFLRRVRDDDFKSEVGDLSYLLENLEKPGYLAVGDDRIKEYARLVVKDVFRRKRPVLAANFQIILREHEKDLRYEENKLHYLLGKKKTADGKRLSKAILNTIYKNSGRDVGYIEDQVEGLVHDYDPGLDGRKKEIVKDLISRNLDMIIENTSMEKSTEDSMEVYDENYVARYSSQEGAIIHDVAARKVNVYRDIVKKFLDKKKQIEEFKSKYIAGKEKSFRAKLAERVHYAVAELGPNKSIFSEQDRNEAISQLRRKYNEEVYGEIVNRVDPIRRNPDSKKDSDRRGIKNISLYDFMVKNDKPKVLNEIRRELKFHYIKFMEEYGISRGLENEVYRGNTKIVKKNPKRLTNDNIELMFRDIVNHYNVDGEQGYSEQGKKHALAFKALYKLKSAVDQVTHIFDQGYKPKTIEEANKRRDFKVNKFFGLI